MTRGIVERPEQQRGRSRASRDAQRVRTPRPTRPSGDEWGAACAPAARPGKHESAHAAALDARRCLASYRRGDLRPGRRIARKEPRSLAAHRAREATRRDAGAARAAVRAPRLGATDSFTDL